LDTEFSQVRALRSSIRKRDEVGTASVVGSWEELGSSATAFASTTVLFVNFLRDSEEVFQ